jgi:hypothetical protein
MPLWLSQSRVKLHASEQMNADTSQAKLHDAGWSVGEIASGGVTTLEDWRI